MSDLRKKPGVLPWATALIVVALIGYPLSYSPVCRLVDSEVLPRDRTHEFYGPLLAVIARSPKPVRELAINYAELFEEESAIPYGVWWILTDRNWRKSKR